MLINILINLLILIAFAILFVTLFAHVPDTTMMTNDERDQIQTSWSTMFGLLCLFFFSIFWYSTRHPPGFYLTTEALAFR